MQQILCVTSWLPELQLTITLDMYTLVYTAYGDSIIIVTTLFLLNSHLHDAFVNPDRIH